MSDEPLPAPWTSRLCETCGNEHPPSEDCLPGEPLLRGLDQFPETELLNDLAAIFGPPIEFAPGILLFTKEPKE